MPLPVIGGSIINTVPAAVSQNETQPSKRLKGSLLKKPVVVRTHNAPLNVRNHITTRKNHMADKGNIKIIFAWQRLRIIGVRARAISNAKMPANISVNTGRNTHAYKSLSLFLLSLISSINSFKNIPS